MSGASPLTFVISHILSLSFLPSTLTPQISVTYPCALLIVISCTSIGKPCPCGMLHGHSTRQTGPPNSKAFCLVISGADTCQELKTCLGPRRTVPLMSCCLGLCAW